MSDDADVTGSHPERDMVAEQQLRSREQIARFEHIRSILERIRVTGESPDRSVSVTLGAGGTIVGMGISPQAMRKQPEVLAATIMDAIKVGLAQVAARTAAEVEPLTGHRVDIAAITSGRLPSRGAENFADDEEA
jgi:DNA-binding protein YbaB